MFTGAYALWEVVQVINGTRLLHPVVYMEQLQAAGTMNTLYFCLVFLGCCPRC